MFPVVCALAIVASCAVSGAPPQAWTFAPDAAPIPAPVVLPTIATAHADTLPIEAWRRADGDEDDIPYLGRTDEGYAPPGANGVAGIPIWGTAPWQIVVPATDTSYAVGYSTKPSYLPGETVDLKVSTTAPTFDVSFWRYSNTGPATEQPFALVSGQTNLPGTVGAKATMDKTTHMFKTKWAINAHITIPAAAPSGVYLVRLSGSTNTQSFIPIIVRKATAAKYLYIVPSMTWNAYNAWGGTSLYQTAPGLPTAIPYGPSGGPRATAVSFDRPYLAGYGFPMFGAEDMTLIKWLQQNDYDVAYTTDTDLSIDPSKQPDPKAVIIGGHSEYWTAKMYDWLNTGINVKGRFGLASFGANSGFWVCTMLDGGRTEKCLKREAERLKSGKVRPGKDNMRDVGRPEEAIFGAEYGVIVVGGGPVKISATAAETGLLAGTGLKTGSSLGNIAGYEIDQVHPGDCGPLKCKYDLKFATSTVRQRANPCGCPYNATQGHGNTMVRRLPSGRRVFSSGSLWWSYGLDPAFAKANGVPAGFGQLMKNIMAYTAR